MAIYTAADFRDARFAEHPDGRVAARTGVDWAQWAFKCSECETDEEREECDGHDFGPDGYMASNGWVPVQENPRPLTADDITDEMVERALAVERRVYDDGYTTEPETMRELLTAALTEPTRPEGAEKVEAVLHQYWSGDIDGDDLADRIAEEMNR